jgi:hypothetical protein
MKARLVVWSALAGLLCLFSGCGTKEDITIKNSRVVAFAQPAVFLVEDFGMWRSQVQRK